MSPVLPRFFRIAFTVLTVLATLCALCIVVVMLVDPELPADARFGPRSGVLLGQPASIEVQPAAEGASEPTLRLQAFGGNVTMTVERAAGVVERLKAYGLPFWLAHAVFSVALFELLRRLFRNVGRGESFTPQSVRLVQAIGGALIVFAFVKIAAASWFAYGMYDYLAAHTEIAVSGTPIQLPDAQSPRPWGYHSPLRSAPFLAGLLVLAVAEVFRQGLALQRDADLTV